VDSIYEGYFGHPNDIDDARAVPPELISMYPYADKSGLRTKDMNCYEGTGGAITSRSTVSYTPICRPWFWDVWETAPATPVAVKDRPATFHGIDLASDNGAPFLSLAMPLYKEGKVVGVTAVDAALGQISRMLEGTPVLENGYSYIVDRNGMTIYHPQYKGDTSWSKAEFDRQSHILHVEGEGDSGRRSRFEAVWAKIRTAEQGSPPLEVQWSRDEDDLYYVYYQSVPDCPYIFVMTAPKTDVIRPVTEMREDVTNTVAVSIILFVLVSGVAGCIIVASTTYLGKTLAAPVEGLAHLLETGGEDGYQERVRHVLPEKLSSHQMQQMASAAEKLLTALRFANAKFDRGDKVKELENNLRALKIVEGLDTERGLGVCYNNIGNCVSALDTDKQNGLQSALESGAGSYSRSDWSETRDMVATVQSRQKNGRITTTTRRITSPIKITTKKGGSMDAVGLLEAAVANAQALADKGHVEQVLVGTRLLGKAFAQQSAGDGAGAIETLSLALDVMAATSSLDHTAQAAYRLLIDAGQSPSQDAAKSLQQALATASQICKNTDVDTTDGSSLLMLSIVHAKLHNDASWIVAALEQSARASASIVSHAAQFLKFVDQSKVELVDKIIRQSSNWEPGPAFIPGAVRETPGINDHRPKAVMFVLDCSGSMDNCGGENLDLENDEMTRQLKAAGAKKGKITCSLMWKRSLDLDLHCTTPGGQHICFRDKKPEGSGGELDVDMTSGGVENIYFTGDPPIGHYRFWVHDFSRKSSTKSTTPFTIRLTRGDRVESKEINHVGQDVTVFEFDWRPEPTRLDSCKQALLDIYRDHISDEDQVSLVTFASDVRVDLAWTKKAGSEHRVPPIFKGLQTRGQTAMFSAVARAVKLTQEDGGMPDYQNWIVLLCDGDDNESSGLDGSDRDSVVEQLREATKDGDLKGLIAIAAGSGVSGDTIRPLPDATSSGMMIETSDAGIGKAFSKAASQIGGSAVSETL
jgi:uncharacterized protein YegL